jgi:peptidoglycan/xylan/chitin deacetylase (PgdA/CDA1 family)
MGRAGSAMRFLEQRLLHDFPEARITFFTVAGPLSAYTLHQPFSHAAALDETEETCAFFRSLAQDPRFELAYHGYNHGAAGVRSEDFAQEWTQFPSIAAALAQTRRGLDIFRRVTGTRPRGGKYGGWQYSESSEAVLDACGFSWWCRDWTPRDVAGLVDDACYEPQFFGRNLLVALPTTLHGHFWSRRQVDTLLARRQVIAITEHIAPVRPDGATQTPNVVDDIEDLRKLYRYLRGRNVWHATGSQIAAYVLARERSLIYDVAADGFCVRYDGPLQRPPLTLLLHPAAGGAQRALLEVVLPDGDRVDPSRCRYDSAQRRYCVTVPLMEGRYRVHPVAQSRHGVACDSALLTTASPRAFMR